MSEISPNVSRTILAAAVSMTVLGGCAFSDYQRPTIERVPPGDERIVFAADAARQGGTARAPDARTQANAALIAQGPSASADRGNANLPFDLAEFFPEGGKGDKTK